MKSDVSRPLLLAPMNVRVDKELKERLEALARRFGISVSDIIRTAVREKTAEWSSTGELIINGERP